MPQTPLRTIILRTYIKAPYSGSLTLNMVLLEGVNMPANPPRVCMHICTSCKSMLPVDFAGRELFVAAVINYIRVFFGIPFKPFLGV